MSKKKGDGDVLKELMRTAGTARVREALRDYLKALKTGKGGVPGGAQPGAGAGFPGYSASHAGLQKQLALQAQWRAGRWELVAGDGD